MFKLLLMLILSAIIGCNSGSDQNGTPPDEPPLKSSIALNFERVNTRDVKIIVQITPGASIASNFNLDINFFTLTADYGELQNITLNTTDNQFEALLIPPAPYQTINEIGELIFDTWSGEIPVYASYNDPGYSLDLSLERKVLIVTEVHNNLGQPQSVPGLVNTPGVEDSPQVSPDGEYLIVGTYSPVDLAYCLIDGERLFDSQACNTNFYDFSKTQRPSPFGRNRLIDNNTIIHDIPSFEYYPGTGSTINTATPPVNSYGFKRQTDGSYAEPFVIGIDSEGYTWQATYGFTYDFTNLNSPRIFYSFNDVSDDPDSGTDVYHSPINLGVANTFGQYVSNGTYPVLTNFSGTKVGIDKTIVCPEKAVDNFSCEYGNPHITVDRLWFDNERESYNLFYVDVTRDSNGLPVSYSPAKEVALNKATPESESMPYMDGQDLYYMCETSICRSTLMAEQDPSVKDSWELEEVVMKGGTTLPSEFNLGRSDRIMAVTEPSVANIETTDGSMEKWLYFGYIMQNHYGTGPTDFGGNWNVGRVRLY